MINKDKIDKASSYFNDKLDFMELLKSYDLLDNSITTVNGVNIVCPFHKDSDPSLKVDLNRNLFKCFGCGEGGGGNAIHFISKYQTEVLGKNITYSRVLDNLLKSDAEAIAYLGFNSIFDSAPNLDDLLKDNNSFKKVKLQRSSVKSFMDLSKYLVNNCSTEEKLKAAKLMQDGFDAESIFNLMFNKSNFSKSFESLRNDIQNLLGSD